MVLRKAVMSALQMVVMMAEPLDQKLAVPTADMKVERSDIQLVGMTAD